MWPRRHIVPYVSAAQRRFMHAKHPEIAKRWDAKYGGGGDLPEHVGDSFKHVGFMFGKRKKK